jgi:DNA excision repair protein ERCC-4
VQSRSVSNIYWNSDLAMALLPFQTEILDQILDNKRGLWVVHSGLGLQKIISHYIVQLEKRNLSRQLYLFLNPDSQSPVFEKLVQMAPHRYKLINSEYTSEQRQQIWSAGGVRFVTSRILIVDMLNGIIPWKKLGGIIYYMKSGQMIKENSTENFILRVYAQNVLLANKQYEETYTSRTRSEPLTFSVTPFDGYNDPSKADTVPEKDPSHFLSIKAFTESPSDLAKGWNTLEKVARALKTGSKVYIWPRYRKSVREFLDAHPPETIEFAADLAPIQSKIHHLLISVFQMCVEDLKSRVAFQTSSGIFASSSSTPTLHDADISYQNALFSKFYSGIQAILAPLGSKVPRKIRSLLQDITLLRDLLRTLIRSDAVRFFERYQNLIHDRSGQNGDSAPSLDWMSYKEADNIESLAQQRLWKTPSQLYKAPFNDGNGSKSNAASGASQSDPVLVDATSNDAPLTLEDNGKWRSLLEVIQEIEEANNEPGSRFGSQPIVIITKDEEARHTLSEYLSLSNPSLFLLSRLRRYVIQRVEALELSKSAKLAPKQQNFFADTTQPARHKGAAEEPIDLEDPSLSPNVVQGANLTAQVANEKKKLYISLLQELEERISVDMAIRISEQNMNVDAAPHGDHNDFERYFGLVQAEPAVKKTPIMIKSWDLHFDALPSFFEDVAPHFIILYDPDPSIVRQVECYKAGRPGWFVRQYVLIYKDSLEYDKFFSTIEQEQNLFRKLIVAKEKLVEEDEETQADLVAKTTARSLSSSNRKGGVSPLPPPNIVLGSGILSTSFNPPPSSSSSTNPQMGTYEEIVIVDNREFRSKLPGMLHQHGITIKPQTLIIADYILSPDIAVERKSLPDLRQSFRTGHLYNQTENLTRIYAKPILLIEFDASEAFELVPSDRGEPGNISIHDLRSQLALLTKSFPKLRVCWSRSPAQTAQLFLALKQGKPQPNASQVSLHHDTLSPELSTHTDDLGPSDERSNRKTGIIKNRELLQRASGLDETLPRNTPGPNLATLTAPNLAPFYPFDILQRIPGLNRGNNWKPLLYPSTLGSSSATTATSPASASLITQQHRGLQVGSPKQQNPPSPSHLVEPPISPSKLPDNPLDGSLFEIDDDEPLGDPMELDQLAPRALPPKLNLLSTPSRPSSSAPLSPPTSPTKALPSLAALAGMPLPSLNATLGSKIGSEIHSFLHQPFNKDRVPHLQGFPLDAGRGKRTGRAFSKGGGRGGGKFSPKNFK